MSSVTVAPDERADMKTDLARCGLNDLRAPLPPRPERTLHQKKLLSHLYETFGAKFAPLLGSNTEDQPEKCFDRILLVVIVREWLSLSRHSRYGADEKVF